MNHRSLIARERSDCIRVRAHRHAMDPGP
jgi:hypothetical protein